MQKNLKIRVKRFTRGLLFGRYLLRPFTNSLQSYDHGMSLTEVILATGLAGFLAASSAGILVNAFKNAKIEKERLDQTAIGNYLLHSTDCDTTMADVGYRNACKNKTGINLRDKDDKIILDANGKQLGNFFVSNVCNEGQITLTVNSDKKLLAGVPIVCDFATQLPPVCESMTAVRTSPTSLTCDVAINKGSGGGPVNSVIVNGTIISTVDQPSYTTTTACAAAGATIAGSLLNSDGVGVCPGVSVSPISPLTRCGNPEVDNPECLIAKAAKFCGCYNNAQAMSAGRAILSDGTEIILSPAFGTFKVWKEKNGNRILPPTGLWSSQRDWQQELIRAGTAFSGASFTDISQIAGRVCPPNVFLDHDNMLATDRCLYYDVVGRRQTLHASAGIEGEDWLAQWSSVGTGRRDHSSYFEGNIKKCADAGMRLPTMYETDMEKPHIMRTDVLPDILAVEPIWAGRANGVPNTYDTWTASANGRGSGIGYWHVFGGRNKGRVCPYYSSFYIICVLP